MIGYNFRKFQSLIKTQGILGDNMVVKEYLYFVELYFVKENCTRTFPSTIFQRISLT
jgi:hypothetical protein